jgi:hypothetical protein
LFEMDADLSDASVLRWDRDRKAEQPVSPELQPAFDPLASLIRCHGVGHERETRNVRVLAGRRDVIGVGDSEWSQNEPSTAPQRLGRTELNHDTSLVDAGNCAHRQSGETATSGFRRRMSVTARLIPRRRTRRTRRPDLPRQRPGAAARRSERFGCATSRFGLAP